MKRALRILSGITALATLFCVAGCDGEDEACEHVYGEYTEIVAPSCRSVGCAERVCEKCGDVDSKLLSKKDHDWELSSIVEEPKDGEAGSGIYGCKNCDAEKTDLVYELEDEEEDTSTRVVLNIGIPDDPAILRWMERAVKAFEEAYKDVSFEAGKKGVAVMAFRESPTVAVNGFRSGQYDMIYLPEQYLTQTVQWGLAEKLNDVLTETADGEDEPIGQKLPEEYQPYADGNWYSMPYTQYYAGFVYNASLFEKNQWSVPNTTEEMYALCEEMAKLDYTPIASDYSGSYWEEILNAWAVQYDGVEAYASYLYEDVTALNGKNGRQYALETMNGFVSDSAFLPEMNQTDPHYRVQLGFLTSQSTQALTAPVGFLPTCESLLWEQKDAVEELEAQGASLRIKMMKTPVLSSIEGLCDTIDDDETLSAVVAAIDAGENSYGNVSAEDFGLVKEARSLVGAYDYSFQLSHATESGKKEAGKEFLKFLASDGGLTVTANAGSAHLLLDYELSQEQLGQYDTLQRSCIEDFGAVARIPGAANSPAFISYGYGTAFAGVSISEIMSALTQKSSTVGQLLEKVVATTVRDKS